MYSRMKALLSGALVMTLIGVAVPAQAREGRGFGHGHRTGQMAERLAEELKFTPEQKERLKSIQAEFMKNMPAKKDAMKAAHNDLEAALKGSASDDEVRKKFQALQLKQNEFAQARFEQILSIRALLTPEQKEKFKTMDHPGKGMMKGMRCGGGHQPPMDDGED